MAIEIKKSHRGLFTEFAEANGMTVAEAADYVLGHKDNYSPARVKQANFANNFTGKKYSTGGEVEDGEKEREKLAKEEEAIKAKEDKKKEEAANFEKAKAIKKANDRVNMYRKMYEDYDKQFKSIPIEGNQGKARIRAKKELLDKIDTEEKNFKELTGKSPEVKTGPSGIDYLGKNKEIPSKTGAEIEGITKKKISAPSVGKSVSETNIYTGPTGETSQTEVPTEKTVTSTKFPAYDTVVKENQDRIAKEKAAKDAENKATKAANRAGLIKGGLGIAQQLSGLGNYVLPYQQYKLGQRMLAETGKRPVDKIDPDFLNTVNQAKANATYGYTPEEQAAIKQQNVSALREGQNSARMYGGGASGSYALSRDAANQYFGRGLQSAIANKQLQISKQAQANALVQDKAEMNRRLFGDTMNAWQQNQNGGQNLISAGLQNLAGAQRYNQEKQFQQQLEDNSNPWKNYGNNG